MLYVNNYWVQKRYKALADDQWTLFVWGFQSTCMHKALETASRKGIGEFELVEVSDTYWTATDPETDSRYVVEKRDTMPELPKDARFSVRDQTLPPNSTLKKMPLPGTLFSK